MKTYWSIPGPKDAHGGPCIAFYKYEGSNMRFEWSRKLGWYRFGTRYQVVTPDHHHWGSAFPLFQETMAQDFEQVFRDNPAYQRIERATVYCEFFGGRRWRIATRIDFVGTGAWFSFSTGHRDSSPN